MFVCLDSETPLCPRPNVAPQARPAQEVSEVWVNGLAAFPWGRCS